MLVQLSLENAIRKLVDEFLQEPYAFFTEADAVARFHQLLANDSNLDRRVQTEDGHQISLVHREYPTFFRFDDRNPTARLGPPARRGHYDTVILSPDFVTAHPVETVLNRNIKAVRNPAIVPFQAVVELKVHNQGWNKGLVAEVSSEMGKLRLSEKEASLRYLVVLQRYGQPRLYRWETYWPQIKRIATATQDVRSVFAIHWIVLDREPETHPFGRWLTEWGGASGDRK